MAPTRSRPLRASEKNSAAELLIFSSASRRSLLADGAEASAHQRRFSGPTKSPTCLPGLIHHRAGVRRRHDHQPAVTPASTQPFGDVRGHSCSIACPAHIAAMTCLQSCHGRPVSSSCWRQNRTFVRSVPWPRHANAPHRASSFGGARRGSGIEMHTGIAAFQQLASCCNT